MLRTFTCMLLAGSTSSLMVADDLGHHRSFVTLAVLIDDAARVPASELQKAKRVVEHVFRQSEIELRWIHCSYAEAMRREPPGCQLAPDALTIIAKILPHDEGERWRAPAAVLGFSRAGESYILFSRVELVARSQLTSTSTVLGHAIAHEIGHSLLGDGHSPSGIMRSRLRTSEWKLAGHGQLLFTREQTGQLRAEIKTQTAQIPWRADPDTSLALNTKDPTARAAPTPAHE